MRERGPGTGPRRLIRASDHLAVDGSDGSGIGGRIG